MLFKKGQTAQFIYIIKRGCGTEDSEGSGQYKKKLGVGDIFPI